ncbi:MAG: hypothetical protein HOP19_26980 [Acidobacteria bacterium]|nr:hypothetical protein [Acidobacteriota bacterium]
MATIDEIRAIKRKHSATLLQRPGVVGVDIDVKDAEEAVLQVYLDTKDPKLIAALPKRLDDVPVKYVYSGPIHKQG